MLGWIQKILSCLSVPVKGPSGLGSLRRAKPSDRSTLMRTHDLSGTTTPQTNDGTFGFSFVTYSPRSPCCGCCSAHHPVIIRYENIFSRHTLIAERNCHHIVVDSPQRVEGAVRRFVWSQGGTRPWRHLSIDAANSYNMTSLHVPRL